MTDSFKQKVRAFVKDEITQDYLFNLIESEFLIMRIDETAKESKRQQEIINNYFNEEKLTN